MQGFPTAQALADALANGTLYVCNPREWTSLTYNDNVRHSFYSYSTNHK